MHREVTLEQAAERAQQAEFICRMMEDHPHRMEDCDITAMAALLSSLVGNVAAWLSEEQAQREKGKHHA